MSDKIHAMGNFKFGFHCPGCGCGHYFLSGGGQGPQWTWNGSLEKPTVAPSLMVNRGTETQCHLWIRDGKIDFLADCWHALKGQTVEMPDWEGQTVP